MKPRIFLAAIGFLAIGYCAAVLFHVTTTSDTRLRFLMSDEDVPTGEFTGCVVREVLIPPSTESETVQYFGQLIEPGDRVLQIGDQPIRSFTDVGAAFSQFRTRIRNTLEADSDPLEIDYDGSLGNQVVIEGQGRAVKVRFWRAGWESPRESWVVLKPLPVRDVLISLTWFLLHISIFAVGAVSYWHRSYDSGTRLFYLVSVCTMGAFVGGFHWWVISGELLFTIPFALCAIFLPPVSLHFFLSFPHHKQSVVRHPVAVLTGIYAPPALMFVGTTVLIALTWLYADSSETTAIVLTSLSTLRVLIYGYLGLAAVYYALSVASITHSWLTPRNPIEQKQVAWILWAAVFSLIPLTYTLYIASTDRVGFAFGRIRWPMFLTSVSFMVAYAVGIIRYRMMLLDQIINRSFLYYAAGFGITLSVAAISGVTTALLIQQSESLIAHVIPMTVLAMLAAIGVLWLRDRLVKWVDQRFYGEKYQLDHALHQMNLAVGELLDRQLLADRMLSSCRDVLRTEHATLYLREPNTLAFLQVSAHGTGRHPVQFQAEQSLVEELSQGISFQRAPSSPGATKTPIQETLRQLGGHLIHAIGAEQNVAGIVVLGAKIDGSTFTAEDVTFLHALGQITSVALQCANVRNDVEHLTVELRDKSQQLDEQRRQVAALKQQLSPRAIEVSPVSPTSSELNRGGIIGSSEPMTRVLGTVQKVAKSDASVLIRGESGTGKELLAQAIHQNSKRSDGPLISVHCAALSATLLESELFGHSKGAFTGASQDRQGRFELANGGTLFLDEIGDISHETQVKLLRVLQERRFEPVGSTKTVEVDVRIVTATHQNLEDLIKKGSFREDLYYRLNVICVELPSLRERIDDVYELIWHFLQTTCQKSGYPLAEIGDDALLAMRHYPWPGNIRELRNTIERAVVLADGGVITEQHLPPEIVNYSTSSPRHVQPETSRQLPAPQQIAPNNPSKGTSHRKVAAEQEWIAIQEALTLCSGNKAEAARQLGMPRSTFYSKHKKYAAMFTGNAS